MDRRKFIRGIAGICGAAVMPVNIFQHRQKIYLLRCFVRGFCYYDGDELLPRMRQGDALQLVREPHNAFDPDAIALYYDDCKIGFIPRESNGVISKLMDSETLQIKAEITRVQLNAATWEQVLAAVYFVKNITDT